MRSYNKRQEDFPSLREYNDYLEDVEEISKDTGPPTSCVGCAVTCVCSVVCCIDSWRCKAVKWGLLNWLRHETRGGSLHDTSFDC